MFYLNSYDYKTLRTFFISYFWLSLNERRKSAYLVFGLNTANVLERSSAGDDIINLELFTIKPIINLERTSKKSEKYIY